MRKLALTALVAALALPAAALADNQPQQNPSQLCSAQRTAMGQKSFDQLYGANANDGDAFGKCVAKMARLQQQDQAAASASCRDEKGSRGHDSGAVARCAAAKAQAALARQQQQLVNAALACRAEQRADAKAFAAKYGTNAGKSNAFGKCVSAKARS